MLFFSFKENIKLGKKLVVEKKSLEKVKKVKNDHIYNEFIQKILL